MVWVRRTETEVIIIHVREAAPVEVARRQLTRSGTPAIIDAHFRGSKCPRCAVSHLRGHQWQIQRSVGVLLIFQRGADHGSQPLLVPLRGPSAVEHQQPIVLDVGEDPEGVGGFLQPVLGYREDLEHEP